MRIRILGPLRVCDGPKSLTVRAGQQRAVLTLLAIEAGHPVSTQRLIAEIWGDHVPPSAVRTMQGYVFRLRRVLGPGLLLTRRGGYELSVPAESVDAHMFEQLLAHGRRELALGRCEDAIRTLTRALVLWRGPALADVPTGNELATHIARLNDSRADALTTRIAASQALHPMCPLWTRPPGEP